MKNYREKVTGEEFFHVVTDRIDKIKEVLVKKSAEYIRGGDKLYNFNRASSVLGVSRESYLMNLSMKHIQSVIDMVEDIDNGVLHNNEYIEEKIGDIINYMIILEISLKQRNK